MECSVRWLILVALITGLAAGHSGLELPDGCDRPYVLCWSRRLRNTLRPGILTLLLPPPGTHELSCSRQADPTFRAEISGLFEGDVSKLPKSKIASWVQKNQEEVESLASTYDTTFGLLNPASTSTKFLSMNRTDCLLAYMSGKLLLPLAREERSAASIATELHEQRVFEQFWYLILHWSDIEATEWPVLCFFEFLSLEISREMRWQELPVPGLFPGHDEDPSVSVMLELRLAVASEQPAPWSILSTQAFSLPRRGALATASAYLAAALSVIDRPSASVEAGMLVNSALNWLRSLAEPAPLLQLLTSSWPVLTLWRRIWRHPHARQALAHHCSIVYDPIWDLRFMQATSLRTSFPGGAWPLSQLKLPSTGKSAAGVAQWREPREAWATAISIAPHQNIGSRAAQSKVWIEAVRVLHASVRLQETSKEQRPFIVAVDYDLDAAFADVLRQDGMKLIPVNPLMVPDHLAKCGSVQRRAEGLRFRLFGLVEFDKIIYIDADALVVAPLEHLFNAPTGVFLSATINGTRWTMRDPHSPLGKPGTAAADRGPPGMPAMINTGVMVISPNSDFLPMVNEVVSHRDWEEDGRWAICGDDQSSQLVSRVCKAGGVFAAFCTQGLIDAVQLATTKRLGPAVWQSPQLGKNGLEFLGCKPTAAEGRREQVVMPQPQLHHCVLDEAYNLQATRPHLSWHMPFLRLLSADSRPGEESNVVRVIHWPGQPKPWRLGPGQRTNWERRWWEVHATLCAGHARTCLMNCFGNA